MNPPLMSISNSDTHFPSWIGYVVGLRIGYINIVVFIEGDAAGFPKLGPLGDEVSFLIENLEPIVATVRHKNTTTFIDRQPVQ